MNEEKKYKINPVKELPTSEIKIPTKDLEKLVKGVPKVKELAVPEKKRGRGRPKKKAKPTYDVAKYSKQPIAIAVDQLLVRAVNRGIFKGDVLTVEDCNIGEALVYTADYYGLTVDHPIWALSQEGALFAWAIINAKIEQKTKTMEKTI